jgi:hypothetical protein
MPRSLTLVFTVVLLAFVGVLALAAGLFERRMAIAEEDLAVLDFADPRAEYDAIEADLARFPVVSGRLMDEIRRRRALLQYWEGHYADLVEAARTSSLPPSEDEPVDPELQAIAANALYRVAQRGPQDRPTLVKNLDATISAYAAALRSGTSNTDVAYNYELAVRMRQEVAAGRRKALLPASVDKSETQPNVHGDPGEPPKDLKVEQFQIRIPMDPREIKNSQEQAAGTGQQRRKRG